jgi:hypothetical protein
VVPGDHTCFARIVIAAAIVEALHGLDLAFPDLDERKKKELEEVKDWLLVNKD